MIRVFNLYISAKSLLLMGLEGVLITISLIVSTTYRFVDHALAMYLIIVVLTGMSILCMRYGLDLIWQLTPHEKNVLILGAGELAKTTACELERRTDLRFRVVGFATPEPISCDELSGHPVLGTKAELCTIVQNQRVSRIIVALDDLRGALPTRDLVRLRIQGIEVEDAHSTLTALTGRVWLRAVRPSWFVFSRGFERSGATLPLKRIIDLAFSFFGVAMLAPAMALIALAIRLDSIGPVLYRQTRVGLGGKVFDVIKFRSMRIDAEEGGAQWAQKNDPRMTGVGRFLRKHPLDESTQ